MTDEEIVRLYEQRAENAIAETSQKYGAYCFEIAKNILRSPLDAEESVSDTYLAAWNSIPPQRPGILSAFLGKITRNIAIDRWRREKAAKRGGGEMTLALEELRECVSGTEGPEDRTLEKERLRAIQRFLERLSPVERKTFLCRYWYLETSAEIGKKFGMTPVRVRAMLSRTRKKLRAYLEKEGLL